MPLFSWIKLRKTFAFPTKLTFGETLGYKKRWKKFLLAEVGKLVSLEFLNWEIILAEGACTYMFTYITNHADCIYICLVISTYEIG